MKKYIVEYLENGNQYKQKVFIKFDAAMCFYNNIRKKEWARIISC